MRSSLRSSYIFILLAALIQSCSFDSTIPFADRLFPPTKTAAPSGTPTITSPPSRTPRPTITASLTASATIVHISTQDPNLPTAALVPIEIFAGAATSTPYNLIADAPTLADPGPGFFSVVVSPNKIYWGSCKNNKATVTAEVDDSDEVFSVVIFVRVKSAKKEDYTPWTTGDVMHPHGDGSYTYLLRGSEIEGHNHYRDSWVMIQLVAVNDKGEEVGRTQIYSQAIGLSPCP